jgi:hypothetical protein
MREKKVARPASPARSTTPDTKREGVWLIV